MNVEDRKLFQTIVEQNIVLIRAVNNLNDSLTGSPTEQEWADGKPMGEILRLILAVERQEAAFDEDRQLRLKLITDDVERLAKVDKVNRNLFRTVAATAVLRVVIDLAILAALVWIIFGLNL